MVRKYLNPRSYLRKASDFIAQIRLKMGLPIQLVINIDEHNISFFVTSFLEYRLRARQSYYREKVTMHWLRHVVESGDIVYDVGANVGAYSLYAGYKVSPGGGQVYAFEPAFLNFFPLSRNIEINGLNTVVIPYPIAIGSPSRVDNFFLSSTVSGSALHGLSKPESEGTSFEPEFLQGIYVLSLDELVLSLGLQFPNHIKIDVDGLEADIVKGMRTVLRDIRLRSLMIEINEDISQGTIEDEITASGLVEEKVERWVGKNTYNKLYLRQ